MRAALADHPNVGEIRGEGDVVRLNLYQTVTRAPSLTHRRKSTIHRRQAVGSGRYWPGDAAGRYFGLCTAVLPDLCSRRMKLSQKRLSAINAALGEFGQPNLPELQKSGRADLFKFLSK